MPNPQGNPEWKPKYGEKTKVVRLPESLAEQVTALLKRGATTTEVMQQLVSVPLLHRSQLPEVAAIYLVYQGEVLLYIGRTENLKQQWVQHHRLGQFEECEDVRIAWFPERENPPQLEATLLNLLEQEFSLIAEINTRSDELGVARADFITSAIKTALSLPSPEQEVAPDLIKELRGQLVEIERRLSERIALLEDGLLGSAFARTTDSVTLRQQHSTANLEAIKSRVLESLNLGKQAPQYKRTKTLLERFIAEIEKA